MDPERDLVDAALAGDRGAADRLLRAHYPRIWAICRRITGNDADAADAAQEAMITIMRRLDRFDGRASFGTWVYRVTTNACLDELRRRKRRPDPGLPEHDHDLRAAHDPDIAASVTSQMVLDDALRSLPDDFRAAMALRDLCDLDYATISDVLGIPPGTVRSRIARARRLVADHLNEQGNQPESPERPTKHQ